MKVKEPPIDWALALVLERKTVKGWSFEDLAALTGYNAGSLQMLFRKSPKLWTPKARIAICKALGITDEVFYKACLM